MEYTYRNIDESEKNIATVQRIWSELLAAGATRHDTLVAIGGGATLDTVGFAAATYKRGMPWIAVPTTLLAMVDAGTGGKTAINVDGIKNAVGAFHQPKEVRIDVSYLRTLPYEQWLSGAGEMIKHGLLDQSQHLNEVFEMLENLENLEHLDSLEKLGDLEALIHRSRAVKMRVVEQDPTEQGLRKVLNLGHTIGHAIEALSQEQEVSGGSRVQEVSRAIPHGYAVVYGLIAELYLSHILLGLDKSIVSRISHLIPEYYPRPNVSCKQYERLLSLMANDKKNDGHDTSGIRFVLLRAIGEPVIDQTATREQIYEALDYLFSI